MKKTCLHIIIIGGIFYFSSSILFAQQTDIKSHQGFVIERAERSNQVSLYKIKTDLNGMNDKDIEKYFSDCVSYNKVFFYTGSEGNELLIDERDWKFAEGFGQISLGCTRGVHEGYKFNKLMLEYVKKNFKHIFEELTMAKKKAEELGYKLEEALVYYDWGNKKWNKYETVFKKIPSLLKNKNYQAIYFCSKAINVLRGDLWVFIDKDSCEVITYIRGQ